MMLRKAGNVGSARADLTFNGQCLSALLDRVHIPHRAAIGTCRQ